ncbi:hypothetical protein UFOVP382_20 [uncultured Caudovirales phage]|uniref:Uncharacterized protein n=1 Tax=uncultured Caudovirales phage TaxID=2100421 RepID=A0A6J7X7J9_9CAUD|nr:hypothetical protein UFOVP382_20 [uncultured Caudovirales phage]
MALTYANLESGDVKSRFVTVAQKNNAGSYVVAGADAPAIMVDVNHQRNHDGRAWFAYKVAPNSAKLADGASIDIVLAAASGVIPHMTVDALCLGDAELYIYEGTSATGGTSFTPINRNRNYTTSSQVAMIVNPTVTTLGTQIDAQILPGGSGKKAGGGTAGSLEYVLKPLTNYLFRLTNVNGTAHAAFLQLEWYE